MGFDFIVIAPLLPSHCGFSFVFGCGVSSFFFNFNFFLNLFIYFWLCWVFVSVRGLSLVAASGGHSSLLCVGLSLSWPLLLRSTGSRHAGSVVVAHGPSCSTAYGIFPDQGSNPCPLHWQVDSQPLRHWGSLDVGYLFCEFQCLPFNDCSAVSCDSSALARGSELLQLF